MSTDKFTHHASLLLLVTVLFVNKALATDFAPAGGNFTGYDTLSESASDNLASEDKWAISPVLNLLILTHSAPEITSADSAFIPENSAFPVVVYTITATDEDNTHITFSLSGADVSAFSVEENSGDVTLLLSADYETKNTYSIIAQAANKWGMNSKAVTIFISDINEAPAALTVGLSGTLEVGKTITGNYSYTDPEDDLEGVSNYLWYQADDSEGTNATTISGATNQTYTMQLSDVSKYLRFEVIPVAQTGISPGSAESSLWNGPVVCGGPTVFSPIPDASTSSSQNWIYQFPSDTFTDVCATGSLSYSAQFVGGANLPSWMSFSGVDRSFSFFAGTATPGAYDIEVTATDGNGNSVTDVFQLIVT